ncbi:hypothetical protein OIU85_007250 [Salix viminalis]|uniref:Guanosine nucleotide diphosphate dissociation inhibitor n=1 Tax=Salix viminalis TaxID=40686 RepID=A0A9Q0P8D1_SALVM|nr:hypothetical protein OIU85_007250 [Salix viminalis]
MDRNDYYGGESTSLNLSQPPESLGASKEYNVDMIPKFIIGNGGLVRVLIHTDVTKYLNFKAVDGSFVYNKGKINKLPATDVEALKSPLMGLKYGLEDDTIDFIGHALALHLDDSYLDQPALDFVTRMKVHLQFFEILFSTRIIGTFSRRITLYLSTPWTGRIASVFGGTYMLNKPECKVEFDESGKATSVTSVGETAKCKKVVCDPSYLPNKVSSIKQF